jgi:hypothetical protein
MLDAFNMFHNQLRGALLAKLVHIQFIDSEALTVLAHW